MKVYDHYLFDADGTLFDTVDLICTCFDYVTEKYCGMTVDREVIISGIGSPLKSQLIAHLGPKLDYEMLLADYLQYQLAIMEDKISPFPHVAETLATLKNAGKNWRWSPREDGSAWRGSSPQPAPPSISMCWSPRKIPRSTNPTPNRP